MSKETFKVEGMTCEMCVKHVIEAIEGLEGVSLVKVSLKKNEARVKFEAPANFEQMAKNVEKAGYKLVG